MKFKATLYATTILASLLVFTGPIRAQDPAKDGTKREPIDVRNLLEKGRASGALPEGVVIRIGTAWENST